MDTNLREISERTTVRNYSNFHSNPNSTLQSFIYKSQPKIFNNSKQNRIQNWEKLQKVPLPRITITVNWWSFLSKISIAIIQSNTRNHTFWRNQSSTQRFGYETNWTQKNSLFLSKINIAWTHLRISTTNFHHQNKERHEIDKNYRKNHCEDWIIPRITITVNWFIISIQNQHCKSFNLIIRTTHLAEIKAKRSVRQIWKRNWEKLHRERERESTLMVSSRGRGQ